MNEALSRSNNVPLSNIEIADILQVVCAGFGERVHVDELVNEVKAGLYENAPYHEIYQAMILATRAHIENDPAYKFVTARLLLNKLYSEALGSPVLFTQAEDVYQACFDRYFEIGIANGQLTPELKQFDLAFLRTQIKPERDLAFQYTGLQTVYDRYLLHQDEIRFELPQLMWLRVAMGLALNEPDREARTVEFYNVLSQFHFVSSTPTLFNAGTTHPQLSSCFLTTVDDDLHHIFKSIKDNAMLSKWAGGLGNDWTRVRGMGALIKGTNGKSLGTVPFLKVANDTAVAVNQCFAPDTLVFTADGIKPISEIEVGDLVLGISGTYRQVLKTYAYDDEQAPMVLIDVKHAITPLHVTSGHPFYVIRGVPMEQSVSRTIRQLDNNRFKPEWVEAGQLEKGDYIAQVIPSEIVPVDDFTEDDARLYGILLGDGHLSGYEWGVSGNPQTDTHLDFVRQYLTERNIHFWEEERGENYRQIRWSVGRGVERDATTGQFTKTTQFALPFSDDDIYNADRQKHIARRFSHLPYAQTRAMIQGLLETDGGVSRGKEIYFTNTSQSLVEGLRYQLLRLGVPTAGQLRVRENAHVGQRSDGSIAYFEGTTTAYDVRIPAVAGIAELVGCQPITKQNWITRNGRIYSRIRSVQSVASCPVVHDLVVEGDESYMTTSGLAHNGGRRKGAVCAYLETWHLDIEDFIDLRRNTGDERRRTHDMHTANWIPDLFMKRVINNETWTLFSPDETPDLHDLYGQAFEDRYVQYEKQAERGEIKLWRRVGATDLWRKMLTRLFETGHPWLTWKDPSNIRSPQDHVGVVHSSNLCTEITLNTSNDETAVCNLGSVNLAIHIKDGQLDLDMLEQTIAVAIRMLDNVIDINLYPTTEAEHANSLHRPVGMGFMGFQDALHKLNISYASQNAVDFADFSMEAISYYAILGSSRLAEERGTYASYQGSKWDRGLLPIDTIDLLEQERGMSVDMNRQSSMDWSVVRQSIAQHGMRNSNVLAIAPTATIANIAGVSQSIEPDYKLLYVKSNMSGDFTEVNDFLVEDLKALGLWDADMVSDIKYMDGSIQEIDRIPEEIRARYKTAFEIQTEWLIYCASRRQKWIDMSQSLNLYVQEPSGRRLSDIYQLAWRSGLKTTYYLRNQAATQVEKSTLDVNRYGVQPRWMKSQSASSDIQVERNGNGNGVANNGLNNGTNGVINLNKPSSDLPTCNIDDEDCEACQ